MLTDDEALFLSQVVINAQSFFPQTSYNLFNLTSLKLSLFSAYHTNSISISMGGYFTEIEK